MKRIGVLTSGGDAPGMNACIRAVVRAAGVAGLHITGIRNGYSGLLENDLVELTPRSVSNMIQRGGTFLGTSRCEPFLDFAGRSQAVAVLRASRIDGLVAIGGDGTFRGAVCLHEEFGVPVIGVPGTIDNDIFGCDYTIGYDTAINTALDAIDKLRDTAASHRRVFFVEVMGRHAGFIALDTAIAGGAEEVFIPEEEQDVDTVCSRLSAEAERRTSAVVVVAEGDELGGAAPIAAHFKERGGFDVRTTILGHIQRGGSPTARDRVLASRLGAAAVQGLVDGQTGVMVGEINHEIVYTPLREAITRKKGISPDLVTLARTLAT